MNFGRAAAASLGPLSLLVAACNQSSASLVLTPQQQAGVLVSAGIIAQTAGQTVDARNDYNRAIQLDPSNKFAYYNLGDSYQQAGDNADAETQYRVALELDPKFVPALFNLAIILTPTDLAKAEALYRQVIQIQPTNGAAYLNLGFVLISEGKTAEGKADLGKAVVLDPSLAGRLRSPAAPSPTPTH